MFSAALSLVVYVLIPAHVSVPAAILLTWSTFALSVILLCWVAIVYTHPREVRAIARLQDSSRTVIFLFVIAAALISMVAVIFLLKTGKGHAANIDQHVSLAIGSVFISWWLVHTVFALRYAHMYYDTDTDDGGTKEEGGLDFPGGEKNPDYLDFVYFAFVIGMTFQVSDVEISKREIRRIAWLHGFISFIFNTAIVALSINIISGLVA